MNFKPTRTDILLEFEENKPTKNGIVMPEAFDRSMFVVRAVGDGFLTNNGYHPLPVKVGDRVSLLKSAEGKLTALPPWLVEDRKLGVIGIEHVLGVWEGELPAPRLKREIVRANGEPVGVA